MGAYVLGLVVIGYVAGVFCAAYLFVEFGFICLLGALWEFGENLTELIRRSAELRRSRERVDELRREADDLERKARAERTS